MMRRPVISWKRAANDNVPPPRAAGRARRPLRPHRSAVPLARSEPFRIAARPLLIVAFSILLLAALCGAFLIGLAAVGVLAAAIASMELARRHLRRKPSLGVLDHQVVG